MNVFNQFTYHLEMYSDLAYRLQKHQIQYLNNAWFSYKIDPMLVIDDLISVLEKKMLRAIMWSCLWFRDQSLRKSEKFKIGITECRERHIWELITKQK